MEPCHRPLPAVIMAGSDLKPVPIPGGGESCRFLVGYKGAEVRVRGRSLIEELRERMLASGCFSLVLVAGPRRVYEPLAPGAVIDTDGDLGHNLRRIFRSCRWAESLCLVACDILPTVEDFRTAMGCYHAAGRPECWFPIVEIPPVVGSSQWKPKYGIKLTPAEPPKFFLPGHVGVLTLKAVRRRFACKLASTLYRLRNRELGERRRVMYGFIVGDLLGQDLVNLFHFRLPLLTWRVLSRGYRIYSRMRKQTLSLEDLQSALTDMLMRPRFRRASRFVISPTTLFSLARDLDTVGEVQEVGGVWVGERAGCVPKRR